MRKENRQTKDGQDTQLQPLPGWQEKRMRKPHRIHDYSPCQASKNRGIIQLVRYTTTALTSAETAGQTRGSPLLNHAGEKRHSTPRGVGDGTARKPAAATAGKGAAQAACKGPTWEPTSAASEREAAASTML